MKIKFVTDSSCDLPLDYIKENRIDIGCLTVNINGEFIKADCGETLKHDYFYRIVREGQITSTAQVNVYDFEEIFRKNVSEGYEIIYIGLSSELSGTLNSARIARENILDENPEAKIYIIDSKGVSVGVGALVYYGNIMAQEGRSSEEIVNKLEEIKSKINYTILLDDLSHLKRGGRISATTAVVGSLLNVKPTLQVTLDGKLLPGTKFKGRKKGLNHLVDTFKNNVKNVEDQTVFIVNFDCKEDAESLKRRILEISNPRDVMISDLGAIMGSHAGPDAIGIIFIGNERI